jgi:DNA-binding beta-propeller fold protein YncE
MLYRSIGLWLLLSGVIAGPTANAATLIVANKSDDTVDLVAIDSGESQATLPTGHAPHEVAVSPNGRLAVISNYGDRKTPGSSLTVIDIGRAVVLRTIDLSPHQRPHGVQWISKDAVAVTTEGSAHLLVVQPHQGKIVAAIGTGQEISHMVAVPALANRAFVANIGSGTVTAIDLQSGKKLRDIPTGAGAEGIAISPDGEYAWVANRADDTIAVVSIETLDIEAELPCKGFPIRVAFTPDGKHVLLSLADSGEIVVFDAILRKELKRAKLDLSPVADAGKRLFGDRFGESPVPVGIVVSYDGKRAWVAATQADMVVAFDPVTLEVLDLIKAGREPDGLALSAIEVQPPRS